MSVDDAKIGKIIGLCMGEMKGKESDKVLCRKGFKGGELFFDVRIKSVSSPSEVRLK